MPIPPEVHSVASSIRLLSLDVDGVLTDGTLYYGADGEALKAFHVRDGLGVKLLRQEGIVVAAISGKTSPALVRRLHDLGIEHSHLACENKHHAITALLRECGVPAAQSAHVGDDLIDLPVFRAVGLAISVADAHPKAREAAAWVTETRGGRGAVREIADGLLEARGRLEAASRAYLSSRGGEA